MTETTGNFQVSTAIGSVSYLYLAPAQPRAVLLLAHGAGAGMQHAHMNHLAEAFQAVGVATLRFNFPFMQGSRKPPNSQAVCLATIDVALQQASQLAPGLPLLAGGHSFGGRMTSHYACQAATTRPGLLSGLVYLSFPLHPPQKPSVTRAAHLSAITLPQLFLTGTRDKLATADLLETLVENLPHAKLHWLATADHGFGILKRQRDPVPSAYTEAAEVFQDWFTALTG